MASAASQTCIRWLTDMTKLKDMLKFKDDAKLHAEWMEMILG